MLAACQPKSLPTVAEYYESGAIIKLSHETTKSELEIIKQKVENDYGITVNYSQSTFFDNGRLRDLKILLNEDHPVSRGSFSVPLTNLQFQYHGFRIDIGQGSYFVKSTGAIE